MAVLSPCPNRQLLEQLVLGRLSAPDADTLEAHVTDCARCAEAVGRLTATDPLVEAMQAHVEPLAETDQALVQELINRLKILCPVALANAAGSHGPVPKLPPEGFALLAPPREPDEIGRLGPYRVLGVIGRGGMGVVFRAEDPRVKRGVALKVLLDARSADPQYRVRFQAEAEAAARLRHPKIVQLLEVGEQAGRPYLVLEYVAGGSLADHLAARPQPPRASAELLAALAAAIEHAHQHGVVHRDLKPSNILLSPESKVLPRITDFGLAKRLDEEGLTLTDDLLGTPSYMAPELTRGRGPGGDHEAADLYGLGAILYELLTGRPPFRGETVADTLEQVRTLDPVPVRRLQPKVPRDLETICLKCLEKEPARRYPTAQALADDLGRFLRGEPIQARPISRRERLWKWARRKPALAALLGVSGLSLAIVVAGALVYNARLESALKEAEDNAREARQQHKRADTSYRAARETLDRMRIRLEEKGMGEVPQLKEMQRALLEDELKFYEGALRQSDDPDPAVRLDLAWAYKHAANIQFLLSRGADGLKNLGQAIALLEALPAPDREALEAQKLLADCYAERGSLAVSTSFTDGEHDLLRALAIMEPLVRAYPNDPVRRYAVAMANHKLGLAYHAVGRTAEAVRHTLRAVALQTALAREFPWIDDHQAVLAEHYLILAVFYDSLGRKADATAAADHADRLLRALVARHPGEIHYALPLAMVCINRASLLSQPAENKAALALLTEAAELTEDALRREPTLGHARQTAISAHRGRADTLVTLGRFAEAVPDWDRLIELDPPNAWAGRVHRATLLARAGEHARAAAEAQALEKEATISANGLYDCALIYVEAVRSAWADSRLPTKDRAALTERYAVRSVALLQKLQSRGFFNDPNHARTLRESEALWLLRGREDFRRLMATVEKK